MRRTVRFLLSFTRIFVLAACVRSASTESQEEIQSAAQKKESSEISQTVEEAEKQETEEQLNAETELSESISASAGEREEDLSKRILAAYFSCVGTSGLIAE